MTRATRASGGRRPEGDLHEDAERDEASVPSLGESLRAAIESADARALVSLFRADVVTRDGGSFTREGGVTADELELAPVGAGYRDRPALSHALAR